MNLTNCTCFWNKNISTKQLSDSLWRATKKIVHIGRRPHNHGNSKYIHITWHKQRFHVIPIKLKWVLRTLIFSIIIKCAKLYECASIEFYIISMETHTHIKSAFTMLAIAFLRFSWWISTNEWKKMWYIVCWNGSTLIFQWTFQRFPVNSKCNNIQCIDNNSQLSEKRAYYEVKMHKWDFMDKNHAFFYAE